MKKLILATPESCEFSSAESDEYPEKTRYDDAVETNKRLAEAIKTYCPGKIRLSPLGETTGHWKLGTVLNYGLKAFKEALYESTGGACPNFGRVLKYRNRLALDSRGCLLKRSIETLEEFHQEVMEEIDSAEENRADNLIIACNCKWSHSGAHSFDDGSDIATYYSKHFMREIWGIKERKRTIFAGRAVVLDLEKRTKVILLDN